ncbi:MAG: alpha/beta fold hydrolase [archaeon]
MKKKGDIIKISADFSRKHLLKIIFLVAGIIILALAITQVILYVRFVTGNDIVLSMTADKQDILLVHGENETVNFDTSAVASPLCRISCESLFFDISRNTSIETDNFSSNSALTKRKAYNMEQQFSGTGQKLYRFSVTCKTARSFLCHTDEIPTTRNFLLTMEYFPSSEEMSRHEKQKGIISSDAVLLLKANASIEDLASDIDKANEVVEIPGFWKQVRTAREKAVNAMLILAGAVEAWQNYDFPEAESGINNLDKSIIPLQEIFDEINSTASSNISLYNSLAASILEHAQKLGELRNIELNSANASRLSAVISDFNAMLADFNAEKNLMKKQEIALNILSVNLQGFMAYTGNETLYKVNDTINSGINRTFINYSIKEQSFTMPVPKSECCVFGTCSRCIINKAAYPVIFLHGHDFNKDVSAFYSLNAFSDLQKKLEPKYLNAGEISLSTQKRESSGMLGLSGLAVTFRASYYFDVLKTQGIYIPVQTKSESIETYSIKLRDIIENVKYETGQDKVIIVAHSMGGLVARRYVQLFGNSSVNKLILVNSPNKGLTGNVEKYCSVLGSNIECRDMGSDSLFLNKLNSEPSGLDESRIFNIFGTGCAMDKGEGDGIVLEENAFLSNAKNYILNGSCSGINLLHGELIDTSKYPEFYSLILSILRK